MMKYIVVECEKDKLTNNIVSGILVADEDNRLDALSVALDHSCSMDKDKIVLLARVWDTIEKE